MKFPWTKSVNKTDVANQTMDDLEATPCRWSGDGDIINRGEVTCELKGTPVTIRWGYSDGPERIEWAKLDVSGEDRPVSVDLAPNEAVRARLLASRALQQIRTGTPTR